MKRHVFEKKKRELEEKSARKDDVLKRSAFVRPNACRTSKESARGKKGTSDVGERIANVIVISTVTVTMTVHKRTALIVIRPRDTVSRGRINPLHRRNPHQRHRLLWMKRTWRQRP